MKLEQWGLLPSLSFFPAEQVYEWVKTGKLSKRQFLAWVKDVKDVEDWNRG